ncbi:MAG TPA: urease accessory protein UreF [Abditibacteriaceae bacterium]
MWLQHLQLLDSALPIGAFSHSFGLESLVQSGCIRSLDNLREYSQNMLFNSWATCDAMAIKGVYQFAPQQRWNELWQLDRMIHLNRSARESREGAQKMGKRLLQLGQSLHPDVEWNPLLEAVAAQKCIGCHSTVYGWATCHLQVPQRNAVEGYLYSCVTSCVNNAVRLMSIGQTQAQTLVAQMLPDIAEAWHHIANRDPFDFATSTPMLEVAAMQHETLYSRLFMS